MWPFSKDMYIRAKKAGRVASVQTGVVVIDSRSYIGIRATLVQPGQLVSKGQPIGKK